MLVMEWKYSIYMMIGLRRRITCSALYKTSALRESIVMCSKILIQKRWPCPSSLWSRSVTPSTGKRRPPHGRPVVRPSLPAQQRLRIYDLTFNLIFHAKDSMSDNYITLEIACTIYQTVRFLQIEPTDEVIRLERTCINNWINVRMT